MALPPTAWRPGISGNPQGRRREGTSLTMMIRQRVDLGELIELSLGLARGEPVVRHGEYMRERAAARARGEPEPAPPAAAEAVYPTVAEQQRSIEFLASWGYQRPAERLEIAPAPEADLSALSDEELEQYERLLAKASGVGALPGSGGRVIDATGVEAPRPGLPAPR